MNKGKRIAAEETSAAVLELYTGERGVNAHDSPHKRRMDKIKHDVMQLKALQRKKARNADQSDHQRSCDQAVGVTSSSYGQQPLQDRSSQRIS